jgi:hypothetical protein
MLFIQTRQTIHGACRQAPNETPLSESLSDSNTLKNAPLTNLKTLI